MKSLCNGRCFKHPKTQRGVALVLALFIAVIILGLGLLLYTLTSFEKQTTLQLAKEQQTFYVSDVESTFGAIARATLSQVSDWNNFLTGFGAINAGTCDATYSLPPGCVPVNQEPVPKTMEFLPGTRCKGTIFRAPSSLGWDLKVKASNPFGLTCGDSLRFCDCTLGDPKTSPRMTVYIRDDLKDWGFDELGKIIQNSDPLVDVNGELVLIVTTVTQSSSSSLASVKTSLLFSLAPYLLVEAPCRLPELTGACEKD